MSGARKGRQARSRDDPPPGGGRRGRDKGGTAVPAPQYPPGSWTERQAARCRNGIQSVCQMVDLSAEGCDSKKLEEFLSRLNTLHQSLRQEELRCQDREARMEKSRRPPSASRQRDHRAAQPDSALDPADALPGPPRAPQQRHRHNRSPPSRPAPAPPVIHRDPQARPRHRQGAAAAPLANGGAVRSGRSREQKTERLRALAELDRANTALRYASRGAEARAEPAPADKSGAQQYVSQPEVLTTPDTPQLRRQPPPPPQRESPPREWREPARNERHPDAPRQQGQGPAPGPAHMTEQQMHLESERRFQQIMALLNSGPRSPPPPPAPAHPAVAAPVSPPSPESVVARPVAVADHSAAPDPDASLEAPPADISAVQHGGDASSPPSDDIDWGQQPQGAADEPSHGPAVPLSAPTSTRDGESEVSGQTSVELLIQQCREMRRRKRQAEKENTRLRRRALKAELADLELQARREELKLVELQERDRSLGAMHRSGSPTAAEAPSRITMSPRVTQPSDSVIRDAVAQELSRLGLGEDLPAKLRSMQEQQRRQDDQLQRMLRGVAAEELRARSSLRAEEEALRLLHAFEREQLRQSAERQEADGEMRARLAELDRLSEQQRLREERLAEQEQVDIERRGLLEEAAAQQLRLREQHAAREEELQEAQKEWKEAQTQERARLEQAAALAAEERRLQGAEMETLREHYRTEAREEERARAAAELAAQERSLLDELSELRQSLGQSEEQSTELRSERDSIAKRKDAEIAALRAETEATDARRKTETSKLRHELAEEAEKAVRRAGEEELVPLRAEIQRLRTELAEGQAAAQEEVSQRQAARRETEAEVDAARKAMEAEVEAARRETELEVQAARRETEAEVQAARRETEAEVCAVRRVMEAEVEAARRETDSEVEAARAEAVEAVRAEAAEQVKEMQADAERAREDAERIVDEQSRLRAEQERAAAEASEERRRLRAEQERLLAESAEKAAEERRLRMESEQKAAEAQAEAQRLQQQLADREQERQHREQEQAGDADRRWQALREEADRAGRQNLDAEEARGRSAVASTELSQRLPGGSVGDGWQQLQVQRDGWLRDRYEAAQAAAVRLFDDERGGRRDTEALQLAVLGAVLEQNRQMAAAAAAAAAERRATAVVALVAAEAQARPDVEAEEVVGRSALAPRPLALRPKTPTASPTASPASSPHGSPPFAVLECASSQLEAEEGCARTELLQEQAKRFKMMEFSRVQGSMRIDSPKKRRGPRDAEREEGEARALIDQEYCGAFTQRRQTFSDGLRPLLARALVRSEEEERDERGRVGEDEAAARGALSMHAPPPPPPPSVTPPPPVGGDDGYSTPRSSSTERSPTPSTERSRTPTDRSAQSTPRSRRSPSSAEGDERVDAIGEVLLDGLLDAAVRDVLSVVSARGRQTSGLRSPRVLPCPPSPPAEAAAAAPHAVPNPESPVGEVVSDIVSAVPTSDDGVVYGSPLRDHAGDRSAEFAEQRSAAVAAEDSARGSVAGAEQQARGGLEGVACAEHRATAARVLAIRQFRTARDALLAEEAGQRGGIGCGQAMEWHSLTDDQRHEHQEIEATHFISEELLGDLLDEELLSGLEVVSRPRAEQAGPERADADRGERKEKKEKKSKKDKKDKKEKKAKKKDGDSDDSHGREGRSGRRGSKGRRSPPRRPLDNSLHGADKFIRWVSDSARQGGGFDTESLARLEAEMLKSAVRSSDSLSDTAKSLSGMSGSGEDATFTSEQRTYHRLMFDACRELSERHQRQRAEQVCSGLVAERGPPELHKATGRRKRELESSADLIGRRMGKWARLGVAPDGKTNLPKACPDALAHEQYRDWCDSWNTKREEADIVRQVEQDLWEDLLADTVDWMDEMGTQRLLRRR